MITKEQAMSFGYRKELWHVSQKNADRTPVRCRVNGKCKTWKTKPDKFVLPCKHGLRDCFYITEQNCGDWYDPDPPAAIFDAISETGQTLGEALAEIEAECEPARDTLHPEGL